MPVTISSRRLACENSKFNIYFDHVVDHAGHEVADYLVVAPKCQTGNMVTGVAILPVVDDQVGLVRIYRPALRDYSWEIPHGFVEEGETNRTSALRELMEETGLAVEDAISLGYITPDAGVLAARVHVYLAENCKLTEGRVGEMGQRELKLFGVNEFERMIQSSEIQDTFTLAAWCKYRLLKN